MSEIKLYKSRWKAFKILLLSFPFVLIGVLMIISKDSSSTDKTMGWFCACLFGLGFLLFFYQLLDRRPQVIINEQGIFDRTAYHSFINWNLIEDAYLRNVNGQKFICIVIKAEFKHLFQFKKSKKISLVMGFQEININLGALKKVNEARLMEFMIAMSLAEPVYRENLIKKLNL